MNMNQGNQCIKVKDKTLYTRKAFLDDNATHIIKSIVEYIEEYYSNIYHKDYESTVENSKYILPDEIDSLLFNICRILNSFFLARFKFWCTDSLLKPQII